MDLHAKGNHDDGDKSRGAVLKYWPEEGRAHIKADVLDEEDKSQRIDDRHVEDDGKGVSRCQSPFACLIQADRVERHVHFDEHQCGCCQCFRKVGRLAVNDVGRIREDKSNQRNADISAVGKHSAVLESFYF